MVMWETTTLEGISSNLVRGPFGGALKKEIFVQSGYKVYEQQDAIYGKDAVGRYFITLEKYNELSRFAISGGDFIISCSGTIGRIYRLPKNAPAGVINQALLKITIDENQIVPDFFMQYFRWEIFQQSITDDTQGGAMKNLVGMDIFRLTETPLPPLPEQHRIAAALSDTDALITALERLIAKKRAIKQGAMQELLTGKRRLPSFEGEWVENCGIFIFRKGIQCKAQETGKYPHYNGGQTNSSYSDNWNEQDRIIISEGGNSCGYVNYISDKFWAGGHCYVVDDTGFNKQYLYNLLKLYEPVIMSLRVGSGLPNVQKKGLSELLFLYTANIDEQTAIAEILSDMDAEIDKLTAKLSKLRGIKQGMMSELLTGRIRLVEQDATTISETSNAAMGRE